jgi:hypothetical protein
VPFQYFIEEAFQLQVRHQFYSNNHNTLGVGNHEGEPHDPRTRKKCKTSKTEFG